MSKFETPIPLNTEDGSELLGGAIKIRNLFEAVICDVLLYTILKYALVFLKTKIRSIIIVIVIFMASIFFLVGINRVSVTQWIIRSIRFKKNKSIATMSMPKKE